MKYMGSKSRISKQLAPMFNEIIQKHNIKTYIEPFVGGANMIDKIVCERKIGNDYNKYLIAMWQELQKGWIPPEEITVEHYKDVKEDYKINGDKYPDYYKGFIGFCGAFRGLFFDAPACNDYVSGGKVRNNYKESRRNILKQLPNVRDVVFTNYDYKHFNLKDCFIYCDPPYANTSNKGYADETFDHSEFWDWVRKQSENNIVLISEYNAPDDFNCLWQKEVTTALSVQNRKKDVEKLFIYKYGKQV